MSYRSFAILFSLFFLAKEIQAVSYNSLGQTGLINLPSAEVHEQQSIFLTLNRNNYTKLATITVTPFNWLEASYFYYRPDDLFWGSTKGLYLDKGFNIKLSYKPKSGLLPRFAIGLDDFAGTGQFTREYFAATYNFNNFKLTAGMGWGKYAGTSTFKNPLSILDEGFNSRSNNEYGLGGKLNSGLWFRGRSSAYIGAEIKIPKIKNLSLKIESDPFDYFDFGCCGEGLSNESLVSRSKDSDINFGLSYKYKNYGNIDFSYIKGNSWNLIFSVGFSAKKQHRKKDKFNPNLINNSYKENQRNEFYLDLLDNLNKNKLYLQTSTIEDKKIHLTVDSADHNNPIIYSSRAAYIAKKVAETNDYDIDLIEVGHLSRGIKINSIEYRASDLNLDERLPNVLVKKYTKIEDSIEHSYKNDQFKPTVNFPIFINSLSPDIRTHVGSPERFLYVGLGIKLSTEIQINRNLVIHSTIGKSFKDNFDEKVSDPNTLLSPVRTQVVDYLQESSDDLYLNNLDIESIWSPYNNIFAKISIGYLEPMYGGLSSELVYKPFKSNFIFGMEYNKVKKRAFDQKFSFLEYDVSTSHFNLGYYHPESNIFGKWSYGNYLAGDEGWTLNLSRRMQSGWRAGFWFSNTNITAEQFGEGSFDKGFYFSIPMDIFSKKYNKNVNGFSMRTMTRDGAQQLELRNRLIDSFYGSGYQEINENWNNYLN